MKGQGSRTSFRGHQQTLRWDLLKLLVLKGNKCKRKMEISILRGLARDLYGLRNGHKICCKLLISRVGIMLKVLIAIHCKTLSQIQSFATFTTTTRQRRNPNTIKKTYNNTFLTLFLKLNQIADSISQRSNNKALGNQYQLNKSNSEILGQLLVRLTEPQTLTYPTRS